MIENNNNDPNLGPSSSTNPSMSQNKPEQKWVYQVWKGSNKFLCGGRLIFGPNVVSLFLSTFLIAGPAIAFCIKIYCSITESKGKDCYVVVGSILTILTTYKNFCYHYDEKENPFNNGIVKNLKEIFLSKTPPSAINFREWVVQEVDLVMESINQKFVRGMIDSKDKLDIKMGGVLSKDGGILIPNILQNLDYAGIDDNLKKEGGDNAFDPLFSCTKEEHRHSHWSPHNRYSTSVDERSEDGSSH